MFLLFVESLGHRAMDRPFGDCTEGCLGNGAGHSLSRHES